jgi:YfiH family protein
VTIARLELAGWPSSVVAGYTTREVGASRAPYTSFNLGDHVGDDPDSVAENRDTLRRALPGGTRLAWLQQVHGAAVVSADPGVPAPQADAAWSDEIGIACAVLTADCLPVLLCSRDGAAVAAAHAGWRGLAAGILEATVAALPAPPEQLLAWLGPCIGPCHYRVGPEVRAALADREGSAAAFTPDADGGYFADLRLLAAQRLRALGVAEIDFSTACTACAGERFYSFRRDGVTGRMAAFVLRAPPSPVP